MAQFLTWFVTLVGVLGFILAGRKVWWAWYINIANQLAWIAVALITGYYAFLFGTIIYLYVFVRNAYLWTKEHFAEKDRIFEEELAKQPPLSPYSPGFKACGNVSTRWHYACVMPKGHRDEHGYAGMYWTDEAGIPRLFDDHVMAVVDPPQYCQYVNTQRADGSLHGECQLNHIHLGFKKE